MPSFFHLHFFCDTRYHFHLLHILTASHFLDGRPFFRPCIWANMDLMLFTSTYTLFSSLLLILFICARNACISSICNDSLSFSLYLLNIIIIWSTRCSHLFLLLIFIAKMARRYDMHESNVCCVSKKIEKCAF